MRLKRWHMFLPTILMFCAFIWIFLIDRTVFFTRQKLFWYGCFFSGGLFEEGLDHKDYILDWYSSEDAWPRKEHRYPCKDIHPTCYYTTDRCKLYRSRMVLIRVSQFDMADLPLVRNLSQYFVATTLEPPIGVEVRNKLLSLPKDYFNLSMTYRYDSDIPWPYSSHYVRGRGISSKLEKRYRTFGDASNKSRMVAWFSSNCQTNSEREILVNTLSKHIKIDIFGKCGNLSCPKSNWLQCVQMLEHNYYFYLAFENSVCVDYVTEKYWDKLHHNVLPIVITRKVFQSSGLPRKAFVAVDDFSSVRKFANYLRYLVNHTNLYRDHFSWRSTYLKQLMAKKSELSECKMCEYATIDKRLQNRKIDIKLRQTIDFGSWFAHTKACDNAVVKNWFN